MKFECGNEAIVDINGYKCWLCYKKEKWCRMNFGDEFTDKLKECKNAHNRQGSQNGKQNRHL